VAGDFNIQQRRSELGNYVGGDKQPLVPASHLPIEPVEQTVES